MDSSYVAENAEPQFNHPSSHTRSIGEGSPLLAVHA